MRRLSKPICALALLVAVASMLHAPEAGAATTVTWTPGSIPWADPELANPQRGAYRWYDEALLPANWPASDSYRRFNWRELEPTEGAYAWPLIDSQLAAAASRGGRFGFRVMPANSWDGGTSM